MSRQGLIHRRGHVVAVTLESDCEVYSVRYRFGQEQLAALAIWRWAANPELGFDFDDGLRMVNLMMRASRREFRREVRRLKRKGG